MILKKLKTTFIKISLFLGAYCVDSHQIVSGNKEYILRPEFFYKLIYGKFFSELGSGTEKK